MDRYTQRALSTVAYIGPDALYPATGDTAAELLTSSVRTILAQLAAYEDTGLTPEELQLIIKGIEVQNMNELKAERDALAAIVRNISGCTHCKHISLHTSKEPCKWCHEKDNYPYWEWIGAKDNNVPGKTATDTNVGSKVEG